MVYASPYKVDEYVGELPLGSKVIEIEELLLNGQKFLQVVYLQSNNEINILYANVETDKVSSQLPEDSVGINSSPPHSREILRIANEPTSSEKRHRISVKLSDATMRLSDVDVTDYVGSDSLLDDKYENDLKKYLEERERAFKQLKDSVIERFALDSSTVTTTPLNYQYFEAMVSSDQIGRMVDTPNLIKSVNLATPSVTGIAEATAESRANTNDFNWLNGGGGRIGVIESLNNGSLPAGTAGCAPANTTPFYDNLEGVDGTHGQRVVGVIEAVSPNSYVFCTGVESNTGYGSLSNLNPHVINASFQYRNIDSAGNPVPSINGVPYPARAREYDDLTWESRALVVGIAGNASPVRTELNAMTRGPNTLAIGNYRDNGTINPSSLFQEYLGYQKPELSAIGTNIAAEGLPNASGTSFAAPHVSGVLGALSAEYTPYRFRPALAKALVAAGALRPITGGSGMASNGYGGIDAGSYHDGTTKTHEIWAVRASWNAIDSLTDGSRNGKARRNVFIPISSGSARVAIAYMKDPDIIWANRSAARPLGTDYNVSVFGPSGQYLGGSYDWADPLEVFDFPLVGAGTYRVEVTNQWERDSTSATLIDFGLVLNWDL